MTLAFKEGALQTLEDVGAFIDSINTPGSGSLWIDNFERYISGYAKPNVSYALCAFKEFAQEGLSCISYSGWVIAFKIENEEFIVHYIIRGNLLQ